MAVKKEKKISNRKPNTDLTPEQEKWLKDEWISGQYSSARKLHEAGLKHFGDGNFPATHTSVNRFVNWLKFEDNSGHWYIDPEWSTANNMICLDVLSEVVYRTRGEVQHLTKGEAKRIASLHNINPNIDSWSLYKLAVEYQRLVIKELSTLELDVELAKTFTAEKLNREEERHDPRTIKIGHYLLEHRHGVDDPDLGYEYARYIVMQASGHLPESTAADSMSTEDIEMAIDIADKNMTYHMEAY
jgi:hypothetical protein